LDEDVVEAEGVEVAEAEEAAGAVWAAPSRAPGPAATASAPTAATRSPTRWDSPAIG